MRSPQCAIAVRLDLLPPIFEEASRHAAKDDPAPILHFNRCVRALTGSPDLAAAAEVPHQPRYEFGD